jgi:hypothetical protein
MADDNKSKGFSKEQKNGQKGLNARLQDFPDQPFE